MRLPQRRSGKGSRRRRRLPDSRVASSTSAGSVRDALGAAVDALNAAGVEDPRLDAELLLSEASGRDRAWLAANPEADVPAAAARRCGEMVRRRLRREPVAYILGRKGFRRIDLAVDRRVLIPRPETELLVELALELRPATVLDVGTGSGAIALALADELPSCEVTATDTSAGALEVARANARRLGFADRVRFLDGTIPAAEDAEAEGDGAGFDLIVANLPYVAERDWAALQPEVTEWEPREALLAGPDGLDAIRAFLVECVTTLRRYPAQTRSALALEVGDGQAGAVAGLLHEAGFGEIETRRDLAGIERVVWGKR
jgi:release factor glutamine methyltransferase